MAEPSVPTPNAPKPKEHIDYIKLFDEVKAKPCKVVRVEKVFEDDGRQIRTKSELIDSELERIFKANTLEEIHSALDEAGKGLAQLGVFKEVNMMVSEEPLNDPEACTVSIDVEEKNWYRLRAGTFVQGSESTFETSASVLNVTGNAERISVHGEFGMEKSSVYSVTYEQPKVFGLPVQFEASIQKYLKNFLKTSSFTEEFTGGVLAVKSLDSEHAVTYEAGWRRLMDPTATASRAVLANTGDSLKSVMRYVFTRDKRNHPSCPTSGWAVRSTSEVLGLGGEVAAAHVKQQFEAMWAAPITELASLNVGVNAGVLLPLTSSATSSPSCIADRLFLGGPSSLRGFSYRGVGPRDLRRPSKEKEATREVTPLYDSLGGDLCGSVMAAINFKLPHPALQALNIHAHTFVNGGSVVQLTGNGKSMKENVREFGTTFRWSLGAGLVIPTWFGKFEANYVHALSFQEGDRLKKGLQLGFATSGFM